MSRCCCRRQTVSTPAPAPMIMPQTNNCICSLPALVILILIVLQFSRRGCCDGEDGGDGGWGGGCNQVGNGILFIIALFFLSCAGCGRGGYGAY